MASIESRQNKSGFTWRVAWRQPDLPGLQRQSFATLPEALEFKAATEQARNRWPHGWVRGWGWDPVSVDWYPPAGSVLTRSAVERWFRSTPDTRDREPLLRTALTCIGDIPVHRLCERELNEWQRIELSRKVGSGKNLAPSTFLNERSCLSRFLEWCVRQRLIRESPVRYMDPPPRRITNPFARIYLLPQEWTFLSEHLSSRARHFATGSLLTGCRFSEAASLRAGDFVDGETPQIRVWRQWSESSRIDTPLKTPGSVRAVYLDAAGREFFQAAVDSLRPSDLIFTNSQGGRWRSNYWYRRDTHGRGLVWLAAVDAIRASGSFPDLPDNLGHHVLRRTYASWMAGAGVDRRVIQAQLGHSDPTMTERYYAHLPDRNRAYAVVQSAALRGIFPDLN